MFVQASTKPFWRLEARLSGIPSSLVCRTFRDLCLLSPLTLGACAVPAFENTLPADASTARATKKDVFTQPCRSLRPGPHPHLRPCRLFRALAPSGSGVGGKKLPKQGEHL